MKLRLSCAIVFVGFSGLLFAVDAGEPLKSAPKPHPATYATDKTIPKETKDRIRKGHQNFCDQMADKNGMKDEKRQALNDSCMKHDPPNSVRKDAMNPMDAAAGSCKAFDIGSTENQCVGNCVNAGCNFIYADGSEWCRGWCDGHFDPPPEGKCAILQPMRINAHGRACDAAPVAVERDVTLAKAGSTKPLSRGHLPPG